MSEATNSGMSVAKQNWDRYLYVTSRGHRQFCTTAVENERMFLGGGLQWKDEDKKTLEASGRIAVEVNEVGPGVTSAVGYQIHNRMDITFQPAGGKADSILAKVRSKVAKKIADQNKLRIKETDVFEDGMIEQRGYFDLRMDYSKNILGDLVVDVLDPMDVIPDPDAKTYEPDGWSDVTITRFLTLDTIENRYGAKARMELEKSRPETETDFGTAEGTTEDRNKFGNERHVEAAEWDAWHRERGILMVRVIDRQRFVYEKASVAIHPDGTIEQYDRDDKEKAAELTSIGCLLTFRVMRQVKRVVTAKDVVLFDDYSPFPFYSVIPFFPYFRRGVTRGFVDWAKGPQILLNKGLAQYSHIVNSTANSGWISYENSLANMTPEQLEQDGALTGLHIEVKQGYDKPEKIKPNPVPQGIDVFIQRMTDAIRNVTVPEEMRGISKADQSGVAIQAEQFASQQQLARPMDNLARTRYMLADAINWIISNHYDSHRIFRITETDPNTGEDVTEDLEINVMLPDGTYKNDMTVGIYDVVVTEQPMQITWQNSQYQQALDMRKAGIAIKDQFVVKYSNLADKYDVIAEMKNSQGNPVEEAKAELIKAQTEKTQAETVSKKVETQFSATQAAQNIATIPAVAPMADALLGSAGFQDANAAPAIPMPPAAIPGAEMAPENTNPLTPQNPSVGMNEGIEGGSE